MPSWKLSLAIAALWTSMATAVDSAATIELINHQPFPIRMPIEVRQLHLPNETFMTSDHAGVQPVGSNLVFVARVEAGSERRLALSAGKFPVKPALALQPAQDGINLSHDSADLGRLTWDIVLKNVTRKGAESESQASTREDLDAGFKPLPLAFQKTATGQVFDTWQAQARKSGLTLALELRAFHEGFLDLNARLTNESAASISNVYVAVVCRWDQPQVKARSLCYDNHITPLADKAWSPFREGQGRHLFVQRGVDWIRTEFSSGASVAWLNDFAPSFTVKRSGTAKTPAGYVGANLSQLGQEAQAANDRVYSITEIARSNIKSYRDRLKENILPPRGESVGFNSRLVFGKSNLDDHQADQMFVGWTSFNEQVRTPATTKIIFGARSVRFGTSYFPYSTLGENFDALKLPGMDRDSFWPLAADTVTQWRLFADDIRRDLRIAKAMGFQLIRLHHLELLGPVDKRVREEYLDFFFSELRHLKLKALIDIYASPEQITALLQRYADVVDSVEIENEILIWGIPLDRPAEWNRVYDAVKQAAPDVRVHLTGYNNTGIFDRLTALGVKFDRVCLHSYIDSLDAIPSARGYALALSSYASKIGKAPLITEWNWRGLTRMTGEARARVYPQIIEGAVGTRGIPEFYQFQFNETLAPNPRAGRGNILRHYELLHLSRRPKPEALVLVDLIRKYSAPDDEVRTIEVAPAVLELKSDGTGAAKIVIGNRSAKSLALRVTLEAPEGVQTLSSATNGITLSPGGQENLSINVCLKEHAPGYYHVFLRLESDDGLLRYAWVEARMSGAPKVDSDDIRADWTQPITVVYGQDAPALEVETAIAIAETLESAIGKPIEALQLDYLPKLSLQTDTLILVGTRQSHPLIADPKLRIPEGTNGLIAPIKSLFMKSGIAITGSDSQAVEKAGMEFLLRYWKNAKDSAARKVGLSNKSLPRGVDAVKLP